MDQAEWFKTYIISPLGLSFFCFELIAYLVDVYRGAPIANSFLEFTTYKFLFTKLISGPITRYHHLNYQFKSLTFQVTEQIVDVLCLIAKGVLLG